jgi:hypothetical protein
MALNSGVVKLSRLNLFEEFIQPNLFKERYRSSPELRYLSREETFHVKAIAR